MMPHNPDQPPVDETSPLDESESQLYDPESWRNQMDTRSKRMLWVTTVVGIVFGGAAFIYKVIEFMFTLSSPESRGFAEVPVMVYFCVAAGWLFLLAWCFLTGKLKNNEEAKFEMLRMEEDYERLGI
jgi:hypothetical protein